MSLLSWNCRGLGNQQTVNALKKIIKAQVPNLVFLMETKSDIGWMEYVRDQCEFKNGLFVPSDGASSGLALLWRKEVTVRIHNYSSSHIDAFVDGGVDGWWHLTGFYGNPETSRCYESWSLLKSLSNYSQLPWLVIGDFNELVGLSEKESGASRPASQMERFKEVIDVCGLKDLGFIGPRFTWLYQKFNGTQIRERVSKADIFIYLLLLKKLKLKTKNTTFQLLNIYRYKFDNNKNKIN